MHRLALAFVLWASTLTGAGLDEAARLYDHTEYTRALSILEPIPEKTAPVFDLMGRCYYQLGEYKKASDALEKAVKSDPQNSFSTHWLGRAYGKRAESANVFAAPGLASKTRKSFEKAVELDSTNVEAMSDLLEYYLEAPGFLGGGMDKAQAMAKRIAALDPAEGHYAYAQIYRKEKDFGKVEKELRNAVAAAPKQVGRIIDLAKFLANRGRFNESDQWFERAEAEAPDKPSILFHKADAYLQAKRDVATARKLLEQYLKADLTPDDPSRKEARKLLEGAGS